MPAKRARNPWPPTPEPSPQAQEATAAETPVDSRQLPSADAPKRKGRPPLLVTKAMLKAAQPKRPIGRPKTGKGIVTPARARMAIDLQRSGLSYEMIGQQLDCGKTAVFKLLALARQLEAGGPMDDSPHTVKLTRTGSAPLEFEGILRSQASSEFIGTKPDKPNSHYWTIEIYETKMRASDHPAYVVSIVYHKQHKGQRAEHHFVTTTGNRLSNPGAALRAYNPLDVLSGYPPGERFADVKAHLEDACKRQFAELISIALQPFPEPLESSLQAEARTPTSGPLTPRIIEALDELGEATRPFVELQTPQSTRLVEAVRVISALLIAPELTASK